MHKKIYWNNFIQFIAHWQAILNGAYMPLHTHTYKYYTRSGSSFQLYIYIGCICSIHLELTLVSKKFWTEWLSFRKECRKNVSSLILTNRECIYIVYQTRTHSIRKLNANAQLVSNVTIRWWRDGQSADLCSYQTSIRMCNILFTQGKIGGCFTSPQQAIIVVLDVEGKKRAGTILNHSCSVKGIFSQITCIPFFCPTKSTVYT